MCLLDLAESYDDEDETKHLGLSTIIICQLALKLNFCATEGLRLCLQQAMLRGPHGIDGVLITCLAAAQIQNPMGYREAMSSLMLMVNKAWAAPKKGASNDTSSRKIVSADVSFSAGTNGIGGAGPNRTSDRVIGPKEAAFQWLPVEMKTVMLQFANDSSREKIWGPGGFIRTDVGGVNPIAGLSLREMSWMMSDFTPNLKPDDLNASNIYLNNVVASSGFDPSSSLPGSEYSRTEADKAEARLTFAGVGAAIGFVIGAAVGAAAVLASGGVALVPILVAGAGSGVVGSIAGAGTGLLVAGTTEDIYVVAEERQKKESEAKAKGEKKYVDPDNSDSTIIVDVSRIMAMKMGNRKPVQIEGITENLIAAHIPVLIGADEITRFDPENNSTEGTRNVDPSGGRGGFLTNFGNPLDPPR